jgi:hypothetical protein
MTGCSFSVNIFVQLNILKKHLQALLGFLIFLHKASFTIGDGQIDFYCH